MHNKVIRFVKYTVKYHARKNCPTPPPPPQKSNGPSLKAVAWGMVLSFKHWLIYMKNFKNQLKTAMGNSNVYPHPPPPRPVEEPWNFQGRGWIKFQISSGGVH